VALAGVTVTPFPEVIFTEVLPNAVELMVLVATIRNPFVGGRVEGAV